MNRPGQINGFFLKTCTLLSYRHTGPHGQFGLPAPGHRELALRTPARLKPVVGHLRHLHPRRLLTAGPLRGVSLECQVRGRGLRQEIQLNWPCRCALLRLARRLTGRFLVCSFSAGCVALPALINIKAVIEQRQCIGVWTQKDELPVRTALLTATSVCS